MEEEKHKKFDFVISEKNCLGILKKIHTTQCRESLNPLFDKYDDFYTAIVMLYIIKTELILKNQNPVDILLKVPKATVDLFQSVKMLYEVGNKIIPDFFHPVRTNHTEWKLKPGKLRCCFTIFSCKQINRIGEKKWRENRKGRNKVNSI